MKKIILSVVLLMLTSTALAEKIPSFNPSQLKCLRHAVYFEARNQTKFGQIAVLHVILNRMKDSRFPDQICEVVHEKNAFSYYSDSVKEKIHNYKAWSQVAINVQKGLHMYYKSKFRLNADHYHHKKIFPDWAKRLKKVATIEDHIFYRWVKNK